jgi:leukotriene-A4 hydrolase
MARLDPHSYADDAQPKTRSFELDAKVDFESRVLEAAVTLGFHAPAAGATPLDLDTRGLTVHAVDDGEGRALEHVLHPPEPVLGQRLEVRLPAGARQVRIRYRTGPDASALQWLTPEQTLGGRHPYLFSQCQAIHARSVVPCQDTPSIRQTWRARLDVPRALRAVMAAAPLGREESGDRAVERFEMPQPIPPYLFALAVGELASRELSPRSRVWAEPGQLEAAAWELAGVESMLHAAEKLFGPYDWERFDLLVMPPSFPYGGMENPRLTFLNPALISGDRSQVNVVAHELAHSWTGNLVTNANAEHFWLNEGFTVFAERRLLEALEGPELAALHSAIGFEDLKKALKLMGATPELGRLQTQLAGIDPDEAFSVVPYEKGYLFLKTLERAAGRERFDALLAKWLSTHRFGAATTQDFTALVEQELPGVLAGIGADAWLHGPQLPDERWEPKSERLARVRAAAGRVPEVDEAGTWSPAEWQLYLEATPHAFAHCAELDARFGLTGSKNPEVLVAWLTVACQSAYAPVLPKVEQVLGHYGRMKYLKPLYRALAGQPQTRALARSLFERAKGRYHPIAQQVISGLLKG